MPVRCRRADALRNQQTLLEDAAAVFVSSGVDAPISEIAARAGVGLGTICFFSSIRAATSFSFSMLCQCGWSTTAPASSRSRARIASASQTRVNAALSCRR